MTLNGATITLSRIDGTPVSASLAVSTLGAAGGTTKAKSVAIGLGGQTTQGEVWTLTVDGTAHVYATLYGDTLATIAAGLGATLPLATYDVSVVGRVITISRVDGADVSAGIALSPDSRGGAVVTPQLVFTTSNWNVAQTVTVEALNNNVVDGNNALVFPPMTGRTDQILGPVVIDGGLSVNPEPFLNNPLLLPGETNLPLANGTLATSGLTTGGNVVISDPYATNVNPTTGRRPGFDPRMNSYAYSVEFLSGMATGTSLDVASTSSDILSVANTTPFAFSLSSSSSAGAYRFIGTPSQSMQSGTDTVGTDTYQTSTLRFTNPVSWTEAQVSLSGLANVGDVWTLTLDGMPISFTADAGANVASLIALKLAALVSAAGYTVEARVGLLGDSRLLISKGGQAFTVGFEITAAAGKTVEGKASVTGTPASTSGLDFTMAAAQILDPGAAGTTWTLGVGGANITVTSDGTAGSVTTELARRISSDYGPLVSGTQVFFKSGWNVDAQGNPLKAAVGDQYAVKPVNLNTRVNEATQVDTINIDNSNSPANDTGKITENTITGFGMGCSNPLAATTPADCTTAVAGQTFADGITYSNIEQVNVALGGGDNTVEIASTSTGTTRITTGNGNNTVHVGSIDGHASITTGTGNDTIDVSGSGQVLQLGGLLTLDTGAGNDTVTVDSSQATAATDTTITGSTIAGLGMPVVGEEQTVDVTAASGTYTLLLPGALPGNGAIQLDYSMSASDVAAALRAAYGFNEISVSEYRTPTDVTYTISFTGTHAGIDYGQISWAGVWTLTAPAAPATISAPGTASGRWRPARAPQTSRQTLQALYRTTDVTVTAAGAGTYTVTFTGSYAGIDFGLLTGLATAPTPSPRSCRSPTPRAASRRHRPRRHDGARPRRRPDDRPLERDRRLRTSSTSSSRTRRACSRTSTPAPSATTPPRPTCSPPSAPRSTRTTSTRRCRTRTTSASRSTARR